MLPARPLAAPYPDALANFERATRTVADFEVERGIAVAARARVEELRPELEEMRGAFEVERTAESVRLRDAEFEAMPAIARELAPLRSQLQFDRGVEVLKTIRFESEDAREAAEALLELWRTLRPVLTPAYRRPRRRSV